MIKSAQYNDDSQKQVVLTLNDDKQVTVPINGKSWLNAHLNNWKADGNAVKDADEV